MTSTSSRPRRKARPVTAADRRMFHRVLSTSLAAGAFMYVISNAIRIRKVEHTGGPAYPVIWYEEVIEQGPSVKFLREAVDRVTPYIRALALLDSLDDARS